MARVTASKPWGQAGGLGEETEGRSSQRQDPIPPPAVGPWLMGWVSTGQGSLDSGSEVPVGWGWVWCSQWEGSEGPRMGKAQKREGADRRKFPEGGRSWLDRE